MKKSLSLMVATAFGAVCLMGASIAHAQDKKNYAIGSLGIYAVSGGETVKVDSYSGTTVDYTNTTKSSEDGQNIRLGYGRHLSKKLSLEIAMVDFGVTYETSSDCVGVCDEDTKSELTAGVTDISAVYYKPLNAKANLTFRGGVAMYQWMDEDGKAIEDSAITTASGTTPLLGIGAEFGKLHAELRFYDLTYTFDSKDYYGSPAVLSLGYKFRF